MIEIFLYILAGTVGLAVTFYFATVIVGVLTPLNVSIEKSIGYYIKRYSERKIIIPKAAIKEIASVLANTAEMCGAYAHERRGTFQLAVENSEIAALNIIEYRNYPDRFIDIENAPIEIQILKDFDGGILNDT